MTEPTNLAELAATFDVTAAELDAGIKSASSVSTYDECGRAELIGQQTAWRRAAYQVRRLMEGDNDKA